jgi:hypothetical protein
MPPLHDGSASASAIYAYAGNDPVNQSDPNGHTFIDDLYIRIAYPDPEDRDDVREQRADDFEMVGQDLEDRGDNPQEADNHFAQAEYERGAKGMSDKRLAATVGIGVTLDLLSGGKGKALKPSIQVLGKAQVAGPGHAMASARAANSYLKSAAGQGAKKVHFNQTLGTITSGAIKSRLRPDVSIVTKNGRIYMIEIRSGGQRVEDLQIKLRRMQEMLPKEKRGGFDVLEKNDRRTRR